MRRALCFVLMPFAKGRSDNEDRLIDFDAIYSHIIAPAVEDAGLRAHRADEETLGGIFHKRMFERLVLCEYAVADLSMANPNVFYELGVRHAIRPWSTVLMFRSDAKLPLDVALNGALPYELDVLRKPEDLAHLRAQLTTRLIRAQEREIDSPVHQLVAGLPAPSVDHQRVELMLEAIDREAAVNKRIARAEAEGLSALHDLYRDLGSVDALDSESVVALLLAFRSTQGWAAMVEIVETMTPELAEVWLVQEQYALALARLGRFSEAVQILKALITRRPNAETYGLLGGVYKRQWNAAVEAGRSAASCSRLLRLAAATYRQGFDLDLRDTYPGVNAVLLLYLAGDVSAAQTIAPVVRYSIDRRLDNPETDYWDHACRLELALTLGDFTVAEQTVPELIDRLSQPFQATTTGDNLLLIEKLYRSQDSLARRVACIREQIENIGAET